MPLLKPNPTGAPSAPTAEARGEAVTLTLCKLDVPQCVLFSQCLSGGLSSGIGYVEEGGWVQESAAS
jgi:hypothetical protein